MSLPETTVSIQRHRTAIRRSGYSAPVQCLLRDGLLGSSTSLFDYGCGRGQDLDLLREDGIECEGWDPAYRPRAEKAPADIVNLGYVINVIEDPAERTLALQSAWELCRGVLVVAAQTELSAPGREQAPYGDGVLTSRQTFQKYYTQLELRGYLEATLEADAIPAAPGVFYVFRNEEAKQALLAQRYRRSAAVPRRRVSEILFEQNLDILEPFMAAVTRWGRLPGPEELPEYGAIEERFGSLKRAFALVSRVTEAGAWRAIAAQRREDLLVYLALARFHRRPALSGLPLGTQRDVKAFFGAYTRACQEAEDLLFSAGKTEAVDAACREATVGHLSENALLVRRERLPQLVPLLRIYEGCARALVGEMDAFQIVKLHRFSGKVSYLQTFRPSENADPAMKLRVKINLRTLEIDCFDHARWDRGDRTATL